MRGGVEQPAHWVHNEVLELKRGPYMHPDSKVDVAVFQVEETDPLTPVVPLGSHLDDWLGESDFVLTEAVILGYPPIPKAKRCNLIGTRAEVNALIDRYDTPHVHFVLSAMARGGFSGGLVLSEYGYALGMVTNSRVSENNSPELGYMTAVGVEPIYVCLAQHKMLPDCQAEDWDDFWNASSIHFCREFQQLPWGATSTSTVASIELFDDGKRLSLQIMCNDDPELLAAALDHATGELTGLTLSRRKIRPGLTKIEIPGSYDLHRDSVHTAARSLVDFFQAQGYLIASGRDWLDD